MSDGSAIAGCDGPISRYYNRWSLEDWLSIASYCPVIDIETIRRHTQSDPWRCKSGEQEKGNAEANSVATDHRGQ